MTGENKRESDRKFLEEFKEIYTPLDQAKIEIWRRWNNQDLKIKVFDSLNEDIPDFLIDCPKAYLANHIASPNYNFLEYLKAAQKIGLSPVFPEYREDKFVSLNECKYYIGRLFIYRGIGKNGGEKMTIRRVIDFNESEGKKFNELKTIWGENFIDFHHRILDLLSRGASAGACDFSGWIARNGAVPCRFYDNFFKLFIRNAVLFENYLINNEEERMFCREVVIPSFKKVWSLFGIKPLIVPTVSQKSENDLYWQYYPEKIEVACKKII